MDFSGIIITLASIAAVGLFVFFAIRGKKREPLTYVEFFLKDKNQRYLHIFGGHTYMPDDGDSFTVFEHYVFDVHLLKFIKGLGQRGNDLHLQSEFVKRSIKNLSEKLQVPLAYILPADGYDEEEDGLLKVYRFDSYQSDTEVIEELDKDCLIFITYGENRERFSITIARHGRQLAKHNLQGMSDYFFKTIYLEEKNWLCFTYRKQKSVLLGGMAVCIINYETGALVFDGFVRPQ
jgi:hypothetical protein